MAPRNPYRIDGQTFDLTVADVAELSKRNDRWVYAHAEDLGGVKRAWLLDTPAKDRRQTIRFHGPTVRKALKRLALA